MIDGTFALQISRETVPDFATANIEFDKICDFIFFVLKQYIGTEYLIEWHQTDNM